VDNTVSAYDPATIERGVYRALLDVLDATGGYPMTRDDIIDAIEAGVRSAMTEYLDRHGLPTGADDGR
jgi:hypothetical protein